MNQNRLTEIKTLLETIENQGWGTTISEIESNKRRMLNINRELYDEVVRLERKVKNLEEDLWETVMGEED